MLARLRRADICQARVRLPYSRPLFGIPVLAKKMTPDEKRSEVNPLPPDVNVAVVGHDGECSGERNK